MPKATDSTPCDMIGRIAPAFTLPDQDGKTHKLSDFKGKWIVHFW